MSNIGGFLDVNGVIIQNNCNKPEGAYYLLRPEDWVVLEGAADAHRLLMTHKYLIFWVTSQGSIGEGLITKDKITQMFNAMRSMFCAYCEGVAITEIAIVDPGIIGEDSDPAVRKAKADAKLNVMLDLAKKYDIDVSKSFGVGDRKSDIDSFEQAGIGYKYQILTPLGDKATEKADGYFESLIDCVKFHVGA